ncbi:scaffolding protein [Cytobacillus phage Bfsp1]|nr:scaffolding protein [Cytobacillus phage Bfsp1]
MARMSRDDHDALLNELLTPDLEHSRKSEILQQLRVHDSTFNAEYEEVSKTRDTLQKKHDDLVVSNSQLFRQLGDQNVSSQRQEELEQQSLSESITIESLEK